MNIFVLDSDPYKAAQFQCDKHVVKMILETAQLLSTAHWVLDEEPRIANIYKPTHANHPCAKWVRESNNNYVWLWCHLDGLLETYKGRYGKIHKVEREGILEALYHPPANIPIFYKTTQPQCMPEQYKRDNVVEAYQAYYIGEKARFAKWRYCDAPSWWPKVEETA